MEMVRELIVRGGCEIPRAGSVMALDDVWLPNTVADAGGLEVEPVSLFLRSLMLSDSSPATCRSYAHDLLRWFRLLWLLPVVWERATTGEVSLMVGWLRSAPNPQRRRCESSDSVAGQVNEVTGKPYLGAGYSRATVNHALTVVSQFYGFHMHRGDGPLVNPVPLPRDRRRALEHRSPIEPAGSFRRASLRQKTVELAPRSIPDALWDQLFEAMGNDRDRALLEIFVSSAARAEELLGLVPEGIDWAGQRIWVKSKGSRLLEQVPVSPQGMLWLARYLHSAGDPENGAPVWRTLDRHQRPLTYSAVRRALQRANAELGTNWTLHDLRHTAAMRMVADPALSIVDVQAVLRHRRLASTQRYFRPWIEEVIARLTEHFARPVQPSHPAPGYSAEDLAVVFGG